MRKTVATLMLSVFAVTANAQQLSELYYAENPADDSTETVLSDTLLFYRPSVAQLSFLAEARYAFGFVAYDYRAESAADVHYAVGGNRLQNPFSHYTDYTTLNTMRRAPAVQHLDGYESVERFAVDGRAERFDMRPSLLSDGSSLRAIYSQRGYRGGVVGRHVGSVGRWGVALSGGGRAGSCKTVRGVSAGEWFATAAAERIFADSSVLLLTLSGGENRRAGRSAATREVFALSADEYYNPSVGMMNGRERNSRTTFDCSPIATAAYSFEALGRRFEASMLVQWGEHRRSAVGWNDAPSPMPDYYAYLPSRFADLNVAEAVADAWAAGDVRYTTIDWDEMCRVNRLSGGEAKYTLYDRVERNAGTEAAVSVSRGRAEGVSVNYGASYSYYRSRFFKRMTDLLGGGAVSDTDSFVEDELSGRPLRNNLFDGGRKIGVGDEFGYNYTMRRSAAEAFVVARYRTGRTDFAAGIEMESSTLRRDGHYKKEGRADGYGQSRRLDFTTLAAKAELRYRAGNRTHFAATLHYSEREPYYGDIFVSPEQSNDLASSIDKRRRAGGEVSLRTSWGSVRAAASLYAAQTFDQTETLRFYNDLTKCYCDMTVGGLQSLRCGAEGIVEAELAQRWQLTALVAFNSSRYTSDAAVEMVADADGSRLLTGSRADLKGKQAGTTPSAAASVKLRYRSRSGWSFGIETSAVGLRRMPAVVFYCTPQVVTAAAVSDTAAEFTAERSLPAAATLNLSVYRRFALQSGSLTLSAQLRNLTDNKMIYSAYRQSRVAVAGTATNRSYMPFDVKYTCAYPRNLYIAIGYEF